MHTYIYIWCCDWPGAGQGPFNFLKYVKIAQKTKFGFAKIAQ